MSAKNTNKVNILMVDDQPAKLLSYEVILSELGENLIKASSGSEALEHLLKTDIAIVLMDVSMPEIDGFELAEMIHQHPRFQKTAIIFISAVHLTDLDPKATNAARWTTFPCRSFRNSCAKVSVFAELHRKTRQLERLNRELEQRVAERTEELEQAHDTLEQRVQERTALLALLQDITRAANEAPSSAEALQYAVDRLCTSTGWPVGHVCLAVAPDAARWAPTPIWHVDTPERFTAFQQATQISECVAGEGMIGRVGAARSRSGV